MSNVDLNLNEHDIDELAHATEIKDGIIYVDGCRVESLPNRLHVVDGVFACDFFNAVFEHDPRAVKTVDSHATIEQF